SAVLVMLKSREMAPMAGATIEDETGEMKVNEETTRVAAHFLPLPQFLGFSGSSGPSQVTKFGSLTDLEVDFLDNRGASFSDWASISCA
ncbi:hypothetical protein DPQ28_11830, partial [Pasteurella multocida]